MNRILRSQLPQNFRDLAVFDTTTGSSPGRARGRKLLKLTFFLALLFSFSSIGYAQSSTACANPTNNNGNGKVTFNFQNTNAYPVIITDMSSVSSLTGAVQTQVWYRTSALSYGTAAAFPAVNATNWTLAATNTISGVANILTTTPQSFFNGNLSIVIPAGATYGFCVNAANAAALTTGALRYSSLTANTTYTYPAGGCILKSGGPTAANASAAGGPVASIGTFANVPRGFIGCVTFQPYLACSGAPNVPVASFTGGANCVGSTKSMSAVGLSIASGLSTQWQVSSTPGGPYTPVTTGTGGTTSSYTTGALAVGTYYYVCTSTCSNSSTFVNSNELVLAINPLPTVAIAAPNSGAFCGTQLMTASGASTYAWTPAASLSSNTGSSVYFTGTSGLTVNVTGTDIYGCTGTAALGVTYSAPPAAITMSSTVPNFCGTGGTATISATSSTPYTYVFDALDGAVLSNATASTVDATVSQTSAIRVTGTDAASGCASQAVYSVGLYPLPSATVTTDANGVCPGTSATIGSGLSAGNFSATSIPYAALVAPGTSNTLVSGGVMNVTPNVDYSYAGDLDDSGWSGIPIGFNFNFFGTPYNTLTIGTNGTLFFGATPNVADFTFTTLPSAAEPFNMIAVLAMDNDLTQGAIKYWTTGYSPNRKFVVSYENVKEYGDAKNSTAQAIFYETTGIVEVHVFSSTNVDRNKLVGINNGNGTIGSLAFASGTVANATNPISTPFAYRFAPPANYLTTWSATDANGTYSLNTTPATNAFYSPVNTLNGFSALVTPVLTTTYAITYVNDITFCDNTLSPAQVTMTVLGAVAPQGVNTTSTVTTACPGANIPLATSYTGSNDGLTFQWQVSTDGGASWNPIAGATASTYTATQIVPSSYQVGIASCGGTVTYTTPLPIALSGFQDCYCTPVSAGSTGTMINEVSVNSTFTNNSSASNPVASPFYTNYNSLPGTPAVVKGLVMNLSLTLEAVGTYPSAIVSVWIDYNHSGTYEASEWTQFGTTVPSGATTTVGITIPQTALSGITGMRIRTRGSANPNGAGDACSNFGSGEAEDYLLNILGPCDPALFTAPIASATDPDATVCGTQTSPLGVIDFNGVANPIFMWYDAPTGGTLLQNSANNFYNPGPITATTTWYVATNTGTCITDVFPVTLNWVSAPTITASNSNPAFCGATGSPTNLSVISSNPDYTYSWSASPAAGSGLSAGTPGATVSAVTPTINGVYTYTATGVDATGCTATSVTTVGFYAPLTGTATVTQPLVCGGNGSVNFSVTGSGTVFASDFTSATLNPSQAELCNNAQIIGGQLRFTAPVNDQKGGILITNTTGVATNDFQIDFDMITTPGTAEAAAGFSYSYGPDVVCMPTPVGGGDNILVAAGAANPENGSGSGIRLSFDAYTNGVNVNGIYLMYNCLLKNPASTLTPAEGLYYFDANTSWRGGANTHVTIKIDGLGQMSMWLAGTQVLNNAQLPAGYLTANKATWKHAFAARTGGLNQGHFIDNLDIHYNNFYEYSVDNGATWTSNSPVAVPSPSTVQSLSRYVTTPSCSVNLGTASVAFPVAAPTGVTGGSTCLNGTTLNVSGFGPPNLGQSQSVTYSFGNNLSSGVGTANGSAGIAPSIQGNPITISLPAGATVTAAQLVLTNVTSEYMGELEVALSGAVSLGATTVFTNFETSGSSQTITLAANSIGSGTVNVLLGESWDDAGTDATAANISLNLTYSLPLAPSWFDNSVASAGSFVGTGLPFNVVGTSILPSTAVSGTATAYAANVVTNGAATCYSATVPATVTVGLPLTVTVAATAPITQTFSLATNYSVAAGQTQTLTGSVAIPAGAVVTSTVLKLNGVTTTNFTWGNDVSIAMSGASNLSSQFVLNAAGELTNAGPYTYTASNIVAPGGDVFVTFTHIYTPGGPMDIASIELLVTYSAPLTGNVCPGTPVTLNATTTGGGSNPVYQWNLNGLPISGATSATYVATPAAATDSYTATVVDDCNPSGVSSSGFSVQLFTVTAGTITGPAAILVNDFTAPIPGAGTWNIAGQNAGSTILWSYSTAQAGPFTSIAGATSDSQTLFATGAGGTVYLSATTTTTDGCSIQANVVTVVLGNAIDTPCTAAPITMGNQGGQEWSSAAASAQTGETYGAGNTGPGNTIWFSFVAPASGHVSIETTSTTFWDNYITLFSGSDCANPAGMTQIGFNDDANGTAQAALMNVTCLTPGTTYYIQMRYWSSFSNTVGQAGIILTDLGNVAPAITGISANIIAPALTGTCAATITWAAPVATDDQSCVTMTSNFNSGASFPVGVTTVTYTATDAQGLVTTSSFTVTVNDTQLPTVTAPAAVTVTAALNSCTATAVLGSVNATDNCGILTSTNNAPATFPIGNTTVTYTVTDVNGNVATATQLVTVSINPANLWYGDTDGDGFGAGASLLACSQPAGYVTNNTDCDNAVATTYPGATELCNGVDDNCNTLADDGLTFLNYYADTDADGYGAGVATNACAQPTGFVLNNTDCNDANVNINPGAIEICGNTIDDNCNGTSEEGCLNPGENPSNAISMSTSIWPNCNAVNGTLVNATASGSAQTVCLTGEDKWHQFVATSEGISIVVNSSSADILIELQTAAGVLVAQENAVAGIGGEILNHYGLTAGQVYKIGVRNYNSALGTGTYSICAKMLKRGGCDYGPGPYSLCQYFKATWAGATGTSYTFTFTGLTGPATGNVYTRTQTSDICVLSSVLPTLPYGSTYNVLITNTYSINNAAGVAETISVPALAPCSMSTATQPLTVLRTSDRCTAGPRFRGAIVASLPWVCGSTNWRWEFTELDAQSQPVGLPIYVNRGAASNYINLGTVLQLQYGKTYSVRTAPILSYTGTDYQWGAPFCMSIIGAAGMVADGNQANQQVVRTETANEVNMSLYPNPTHGTDVNINLSGVDSDNVQIRVVDAMGRQVWSNRYSVSGVLNTNITFERPLANGLYMVEAIFNGEVQTQRMMVQK